LEERQDNGGQIRLKNVGGVPIVEIIGAVNRATLHSLETLLASLERAGHYNIVLNIKRAMASGPTLLSSLSKSVSRIRGHYGNIDIVAEATQIKQMANDGLAQLFRLCTTESQALGWIKRLLRPPDETACAASARIMEQECLKRETDSRSSK